MQSSVSHEDTLVKAPQSRRGKGLSTVRRTSGAPWGMADQAVYVKTQVDYETRPAWRLWRKTPTFACEYRALQACHQLSLNVPEVVSFRTEERGAELVLAEIADAELLPEFIEHASAERAQHVLYELGRMVARLHDAGWVHGALAGAHCLVQPTADDRVWLIDFEKSRHTHRKSRCGADLQRFGRRSPYLSERQLDSFREGYASAD